MSGKITYGQMMDQELERLLKEKEERGKLISLYKKGVVLGLRDLNSQTETSWKYKLDDNFTAEDAFKLTCLIAISGEPIASRTPKYQAAVDFITEQVSGLRQHERKVGQINRFEQRLKYIVRSALGQAKFRY